MGEVDTYRMPGVSSVSERAKVARAKMGHRPVELVEAMAWVRRRVKTSADPDNWEPMLGAIERQLVALGPIEGQACLTVLWQVALAVWALWGTRAKDDQMRAAALRTTHEMFEIVDGFFKEKREGRDDKSA
jgi:hypothetical protein